MRQFDHHADAVRDFNRFYTTRIGALGDSYVDSGFSLTEVRVLYELAHRAAPTATEIAATLSLDAGYLSRMLSSFRRRGLVAAKPDVNDRRHSRLRLTAAGRRAFAPLDRRARDAVLDLLGPLGTEERRHVLDAMNTIRRTLDREVPAATEPFTLREHKPGDIGWIVHRHGALYADEYGYDERFEALVAGIVARFVQKLDRKRERCWIAERDGQIVGTIFVVAKSKTTAQLRLLLVEPIGPRSGPRVASRRRSRGVLARRRLQADRSLDAKRAHRRATSLRGGRLQARRRGTAHDVRQADDRGVLAARAKAGQVMAAETRRYRSGLHGVVLRARRSQTAVLPFQASIQPGRIRW